MDTLGELATYICTYYVSLPLVSVAMMMMMMWKS